MSSDYKKAALEYHAKPRPGKIAMHLTVPAATPEDLALAYSPGVAEPVRAIHANPEDAYKYTGKGNLVAVISNGTAILGLGNKGALASKPVMEGKSLLFKCLAGIDSVDIEINENDPEELIKTIYRISPTFGGINLEDIAAPQCFEIERKLIELCDIPVFHDDQHGTAIVSLAALLNAIEIQQKNIKEVRMVIIGAGAAAIRCADLMCHSGVEKENVYMVDSKGIINNARADIQNNENKLRYAHNTKKTTLTEACVGADIILGLSGANLLDASMLKSMNKKPIIFACSNPDPEIAPELALSLRKDLIMATGRSDYPNQVNNVLGFPFIFRGALDVRAKVINIEMKLAAAEALSALAKKPVPESVLKTCGLKSLSYGPEYIIPKPMDTRLFSEVSMAVAKAAVDSKVATLPYPAHYPMQNLDDICY